MPGESGFSGGVPGDDVLRGMRGLTWAIGGFFGTGGRGPERVPEVLSVLNTQKQTVHIMQLFETEKEFFFYPKSRQLCPRISDK